MVSTISELAENLKNESRPVVDIECMQARARLLSYNLSNNTIRNSYAYKSQLTYRDQESD
jgi:hypothetical protein